MHCANQVPSHRPRCCALTNTLPAQAEVAASVTARAKAARCSLAYGARP
jgi:hypothetical protein